jgi:regulator of cell morphogenesis and NO signaling
VIRFDGSDRISDLLERFPECESVCGDLGLPVDDREDQVATAIAAAGLPLTVTLARLASAASIWPQHLEEDWSSFGLDELADHIEEHHHRFARSTLARLDAIIAVLRNDSGLGHPLRDAFLTFKHGLLCHFDEEEQTLFPQCRLLELDTRAWQRSSLDLVSCIAGINREHDAFEEQAQHLLHLATSVSWPPAYGDLQMAFEEVLETLAGDLAIHAHLEYEYLMPSALHLAKLERSRVESQIQRQQRKEQAELGPG